MRLRNLSSLIVVVALIGCGGQQPEEPASPEAPPVPSPAVDPAAESDAAPDAVAEPAEESPDMTATPEESLPPDEEPQTERVQAKAGVGAKGRSLDPHQGLVVTPARTYFTARERLIFEAQVPHALKMYEATHGQAPRTHEEFMAQVIEANQISLPDLPPDRRYVYDPESKELMVERSL